MHITRADARLAASRSTAKRIVSAAFAKSKPLADSEESMDRAAAVDVTLKLHDRQITPRGTIDGQANGTMQIAHSEMMAAIARLSYADQRPNATVT
jgi:hypothetical protein